MTKRSVEQVLREELELAGQLVSKAADRRDAALVKSKAAEGEAASRQEELDAAIARRDRAQETLEAYLPLPLEPATAAVAPGQITADELVAEGA